MNKILQIISDFFLGEKEILTVTIDDAFPLVTNIKDFPINLASKKIIDKFNKEGTINLEPGVYDFYLKSFCLNAGKYEPYKCSGYLLAPIKGNKSEIIKNILQNSTKINNIPQTDVQSLIWAVLANEKYGDFADDIRLTADQLLEKKDLELLEKSFLNNIPKPIIDWLWQQIENKLPENIISLWKRIDDLKIKIRDTKTTYKELEKIAVRFGKPPVSGQISEIEEGSWCQIKDNCFARIFPEGYSRTRMQIYIPEISSANKKLSRDYSVDVTGSGTTLSGLTGIPANSNEQRLGFGGLFDN